MIVGTTTAENQVEYEVSPSLHLALTRWSESLAAALILMVSVTGSIVSPVVSELSVGLVALQLYRTWRVAFSSPSN